MNPIDEIDANAKQHDLDYDNVPLDGIDGLKGVVDERSTTANEAYIERADKTIEKQKRREKDDITGKPVTKKAAEAAKFGKKGFKTAEYLKHVKIDRGPKF